MIMKLAQLPLRERIGLLVALGCMVLLVADAFVLKPAFRHIRGLETSIATEEAEIRRIRGMLQYDESIARQYAEVKDLLGASGPEAETIETFKKELDEMAMTHRVQLRSMRHLNVERTDHLLTYVIEVGDYEAEVSDLLRFLAAVNAAPGLMRVRQLTIASQTPGPRVNGALSVTRVMTQMPSAGDPL